MASALPFQGLEDPMDWDHIERQWQRLSEEIKANWGKLTEDDLLAIAGKRQAFVRKLRERYGLVEDQAERAIDDWLTSLSVSSRSPSPRAQSELDESDQQRAESEGMGQASYGPRDSHAHQHQR